MSRTEQHNLFLRIKALATATDAMLADDKTEEANQLSMMLVEMCNEYSENDE